jgi:signal transduction histidine kinase
MVALLVVALLAIALTAVLATRATRPLKELAAASDAVTHGNLDRRVSLGGPSEVRHVGSAFNAMAENLRTTLHALSHRSALAAVGEFATSLSHDVRNALTAIKVDLDRTAMRELADPVADDLVHRALNNVARLENTVTGALRVARRGHSPAVRADLRPVIRAAMDTVSGTFASIPATLDADLPSEPVLVDCDAAALEQLFANLLFNAAQALPAGGHARVALSAVNGMAEVLVSDAGTGITPSEMEKLATPFYSSKPNGTGLGLPMARQIVAGHGGDLSIESEKGLGTTVRVRLQLVNESIPSIARSIEDITPARMVGLPDKH